MCMLFSSVSMYVCIRPTEEIFSSCWRRKRRLPIVYPSLRSALLHLTEEIGAINWFWLDSNFTLNGRCSFTSYLLIKSDEGVNALHRPWSLSESQSTWQKHTQEVTNRLFPNVPWKTYVCYMLKHSAHWCNAWQVCKVSIVLCIIHS